MTSAAAAARRTLAEVGSDLMAAADMGHAKRWAGLVSDVTASARCFSDLSDVPDWVRLPAPELAALARRTALASMAFALSQSIDGALLTTIAKTCGEAAIDVAIDQATAEDDQPVVDGAAITDHGFSLLAAAVPPSLLGYLPQAEPASVDPARARAWVARAMDWA